MKSFENLVGGALEKAEGRTLASTDKIRAAITEVVESATKRFADATEEMRRTADSIRGDLDATRAELRKGVLEMPQEARESTTAIRRAVGEQIKALKELSDIVAKSGRSIDVSDKSSPPQPQPQPQPPRRLVPPQPRSAEQNSEPAPKAEKPRPPVEEPRPKTGAWVRDLLSGAARAESEDGEVAVQRSEPSPSAPVADSLNSLSVDIARAIDDNAFLDLWNRYRRGETHVFTRRLYTLQGQQTFDEIRRKYQRDTEFRSVVDHYVTDFEKLLAEATTNSKDGQIGSRYLMSDTGKVYTMLAHASGRFD
jgi:hypothetical protein